MTGNLGARPIQALAGEAEKALAAKSAPAEIISQLNELGTSLNGFIQQLRAALPPAETALPTAASAAGIDPERVKRIVQEMVAHLNNCEPAASDCLKAYRDVFQAVLSAEGLASFEQRVSGFAFAEALALLEPAAKAKGLLPA